MAPLLANLLMATPLLVALGLRALDPDLFHRAAQEDEVLEWATFWALVLAAVAHAGAARQRWRSGGGLPWFSVGVAVFCFVVAMEEISWGQRLFGYRSPDYFLAHNAQQELNLHNVTGDWFRQAAFLVIVVGYGIVLPACARLPRLRALIDRLGIVAPPLWLAPGFAATAVLYHVYPWSYAGEWAEAMFGLGMLYAGIEPLQRLAAARPGRGRGSLTRALALQTLLAVGLAAATAQAWLALAGSTPEHFEAARVELEALRDDYALAKSRTRCGVHKRVHSHVVKYDLDHLYSGHFATLVERGLPAERAQYFIDPWNSPYWINHTCAEDGSRRAVFVYSFGPNRRRDSNDWSIDGDDVAAWISQPEAIAPD